MQTQEAYHQYLLNSEAQASYMNTLLWILLVIFVIAPLLLGVIYTGLVIYTLPKCPKCGSKRSAPTVQEIRKGKLTTIRAAHICTICDTEFVK